ncbi:uncharacterized protein LOC130366732 isoform X2 [Hyla sarda]|uniref:uncharacterized protein LOC130366732 isoform X2 n=1 Tax=Hyla sarda TaxID=327740 RepID=UPI0024C2C316|nr:uncharacterized protein LOC130366732 isoform X2 [Hyla sarda]
MGFKSVPIQTQPERPFQPANVFRETLTPSTAIVPSELEILTKVEEIVFKEKVFQTRDGKTLFSVHQEPSGSTLNLYLRDVYQENMAWLHVISDDGRSGHDSCLQIVALPARPLGNVRIDSVSGNLYICVQSTKETSMFFASLPMFLPTQKSTSIEILSMNGSHQVAKIMSEKEGKSVQVVFQFSIDMESSAKIVILGAFLYLNFHLHEILRLVNVSTNFQDVWIIDCMDWENRTDSCSQPWEKPKGGEVDGSSNDGGCCSKCGTGCRSCLCCFGDCLVCCSECCQCCLCFFMCLQCVL